MLRRLFSAFLLPLSLVLCPSVFAGQTNWIYLKEVRTGSGNDRVNLVVEGNAMNPASCTKSDYYQVDDDMPNKEAIRAIALAALLADREVLIGFKDSSCSASDRPSVTSIRVR